MTTKSDLQFIIVDDDRSNNFLCEYAIRVLLPESRVELFENPEEALKAIKNTYSGSDRNNRVVLFLDINMPRLSGWEFLENFKEFREQLGVQFDIYMLSSSISKSDRDRVDANKDISGFLSKPLIVKELRILLSKHTAGV